MCQHLRNAAGELRELDVFGAAEKNTVGLCSGDESCLHLA